MSFSRELYEKTHKSFISKPYKLSVDKQNAVIFNKEKLWIAPYTAWKVSSFRVILVRVFPHLDWIQARITPNKDTFHVVSKLEKNGLELFFVSRLSKKTF